MQITSRAIFKTLLGAFLLLPLIFANAQANGKSQGTGKYRITITNLTSGQVFSPVLVVSHGRPVSLFKLGEPASDELAQLAEGGATQPLIDSLAGNRYVFDHAVSDGPVLPGQTVNIELSSHYAGRISLASMLVNTNDAFVALNGVRAPYRYAASYTARAYDAGSEKNDERCMNIPGPACAGMGNEQGGVLGDPGEGFVFVHSGIHGIGALDEAATDWNNPVAAVSIRRIR